MGVSETITAATMLRDAGRLNEAVAYLKRALGKPGAARNAALNMHMGDALLATGQPEQALFYFRRATEIEPGNAVALAMVGNALVGMGKHAEAVPAYERALSIATDLPGPWAKRGLALLALGRLEEAEESLRQSLARGIADPGDAVALAQLLGQTGRADEGMAVLHRVLAAVPDHISSLENLAYLSNCSSRLRPDEVTDIHRRLGGVVLRAAQASVALPAVSRSTRPDDRMRVAFMSPDLYRHSVASFLEPLLEFRDRQRVHVTCLSVVRRNDEVTARLRGYSDAWHECEGMSDAQIAALVAGASIDVLVDLAGVTANNRLGVMARRPAPLLLSAIGYPCTSGLPTVDLRLCDGVTDPPEHDRLMIERPLRLERCFLCYRGPDDAPEPAAPDAGAPITFGSFNNLAKLSPAAVRAWALVLKAVPDSRLVLKSLMTSDAGIAAKIRGFFATEGVGPERLEVWPTDQKRTAHLAAYRRIDVALDTFPYNGTTTTCEALWMGVPVVTLLGQLHAGRVGASLLSACGLESWIAKDVNGFVEIATSLARDPAALGEHRRTLRQRVRSSPLCDGAGYASRFMAALASELRTRNRSP